MTIFDEFAASLDTASMVMETQAVTVRNVALSITSFQSTRLMGWRVADIAFAGSTSTTPLASKNKEIGN